MPYLSSFSSGALSVLGTQVTLQQGEPPSGNTGYYSTGYFSLGVLATPPDGAGTYQASDETNAEDRKYYDYDVSGAATLLVGVLRRTINNNFYWWDFGPEGSIYVLDPVTGQHILDLGSGNKYYQLGDGTGAAALMVGINLLDTGNGGVYRDFTASGTNDPQLAEGIMLADIGSGTKYYDFGFGGTDSPTLLAYVWSWTNRDNYDFTANGTNEPLRVTGRNSVGVTSGYASLGLISSSSLADFTFGRANFTLEAYVKPSSTASSGVIMAAAQPGVAGYNNWALLGGDGLSFIIPTLNREQDIATTVQLVANTWNHVAVSCENSMLQMYINGTRVVNSDITGVHVNAVDADYFTVGAYSNGAGGFPGSISNVRVIKEQALYTGATISVPADPLNSSGYGSTSQNITGTIAFLGLQSSVLEHRPGMAIGGTLTFSTDDPFDTDFVYRNGYYSTGYYVDSVLTVADDQIHQAIDNNKYYVYSSADGTASYPAEGPYTFAYLNTTGQKNTGANYGPTAASDGGTYYTYTSGTPTIANGYYSTGVYDNGSPANYTYDSSANFYVTQHRIAADTNTYHSFVVNWNAIWTITLDTGYIAFTGGKYYYFGDANVGTNSPILLTDWKLVNIDPQVGEKFYDFTSTGTANPTLLTGEVKFPGGFTVPGFSFATNVYYDFTASGIDSQPVSPTGWFTIGHIVAGALSNGDGNFHLVASVDKYYYFPSDAQGASLATGVKYGMAYEKDAQPTAWFNFTGSGSNDPSTYTGYTSNGYVTNGIRTDDNPNNTNTPTQAADTGKYYTYTGTNTATLADGKYTNGYYVAGVKSTTYNDATPANVQDGSGTVYYTFSSGEAILASRQYSNGSYVSGELDSAFTSTTPSQASDDNLWYMYSSGLTSSSSKASGAYTTGYYTAGVKSTTYNHIPMLVQNNTDYFDGNGNPVSDNSTHYYSFSAGVASLASGIFSSGAFSGGLFDTAVNYSTPQIAADNSKYYTYASGVSTAASGAYTNGFYGSGANAGIRNNSYDNAGVFVHPIDYPSAWYTYVNGNPTAKNGMYSDAIYSNGVVDTTAQSNGSPCVWGQVGGVYYNYVDGVSQGAFSAGLYGCVAVGSGGVHDSGYTNATPSNLNGTYYTYTGGSGSLAVGYYSSGYYNNNGVITDVGYGDTWQNAQDDSYIYRYYLNNDTPTVSKIGGFTQHPTTMLWYDIADSGTTTGVGSLIAFSGPHSGNLYRDGVSATGGDYSTQTAYPICNLEGQSFDIITQQNGGDMWVWNVAAVSWQNAGYSLTEGSWQGCSNGILGSSFNC